jgi:uncharacterized protein
MRIVLTNEGSTYIIIFVVLGVILLIIQLRDLDKSQGKSLTLQGPIDLKELRHPDILAFSNFTFHGEAHKEGAIVFVEGMIEGKVTARCSKCLEPVADHSLSVPLMESFSEVEPVNDDHDEEEVDIHLIKGDKIDLAPHLREAILLDIPLVFVCEEDCKGLCPTCGTNRNQQPCSCMNERIDPRLADLALFFSNDKKE